VDTLTEHNALCNIGLAFREGDQEEVELPADPVQPLQETRCHLRKFWSTDNREAATDPDPVTVFRALHQKEGDSVQTHRQGKLTVFMFYPTITMACYCCDCLANRQESMVSLASFCKRLKTHLFRVHMDSA